MLQNLSKDFTLKEFEIKRWCKIGAKVKECYSMEFWKSAPITQERVTV